MQNKTVAAYDVEVISTEDMWAKYGPKLPDRSKSPKSKTKIDWQRWGIRGAGALLTIGLHALLVGGAMLGASGRPPLRPLIEGVAASGTSQNATEFVSVLLLLNDNSVVSDDQYADSAYSSSQQAKRAESNAKLLSTVGTLKAPEIGGSEGGTDENSLSAESFGAEGGRAMLFGRYMGQVKARIERAWEYPTKPVSKHFDCSVQIKQTTSGDVLEVTLQRCDDAPGWQVSLVQAIQRASPLSAPPSEDVFSDVITLNFAANAMVSR